MSSFFPELYTKDSKVWIPDIDQVWKLASIKEDFKNDSKILSIQDETNQKINLNIQDFSALPPLKNPDILIGTNDLTTLSYLHEPAVLYNLRIRFLNQNVIYTWCGIVLVAVNPFTDLDIYGDETIQTYHQQTSHSNQLDPHIYAVAEDAYTKLERENFNQSIIVSGESGAGKTVSAKFAMRYFASIAGSHSTNIENKVLASNPIMEAIGNATTTRNDNSSRFGKYIQIMFDPHSRSITGGNMRTYLLEKSRVSRLNEGERNFHIFYQMCNHYKQFKATYLKLDDCYKFVYLGNINPGKGDDLSKFYEAMQCLGFSEKQQQTIFQIVAAVLHSGNIEFTSIDDEQCTISCEDSHLESFCELLDLDKTSTIKWLTNKVIRMGRSEVIVTPVNKNTAQYGRDALAKFIYEKMFLWIVSLINQALGPSEKILSSNMFIGVLDIYGFEHFDINSFEQFCINYANEVLQQQFNKHVFKLEQEEYVKEGIDWTFITFSDNQPVIDLIEAKPIGILNLLDEECKMPKGTDETWCAKLYAQLTIGSIFQKPKIGSRTSFIIQHFADKVIYQVEGFLEKNRDTVWEEQIDLLKRSNVVGHIFFDNLSSDHSKPKFGAKIKVTSQQQQKQQKLAKATVGLQFRVSLADLMSTLDGTTPHYVRCIKPNDNKGAFEFNNIRAIQQLRACGVLETIKISSNGFPSRWTYNDFATRYRVLMFGMNKTEKSSKVEDVSNETRKLIRASSNSSEVKAICQNIIELVFEQHVYSKFKIGLENQTQNCQKLYQCGKSKIFFRSGQVALLERIRTERLRECAILLQKNIRGWLCRRKFMRIKLVILRLQCRSRGFLARRLYTHLKQTKASIIIQSNWKCWNRRKKYLKLRESVIGLQKYGRGYLARKKFVSKKESRAAITIQKNMRMFIARKKYLHKIRQIIIVQSQIRRWIARKELKKLKIEARSVEHVKSLNRGLEIKIIELQQKIQGLNLELIKMKQKDIDLNDFKIEKSKLEAEIKNLKNKLHLNEADFEYFNNVIEENSKKIAYLESQIKSKDKKIESLKLSQTKIEKQIDHQALETAILEKEKEIEEKYEKERRILLDERESEKAAHQQLLRKYSELEDRLQSGDKINDFEDKGPDISIVSLMMRLSELEQENAKMKHQNQEMREAIASVTDKTDTSLAANLLLQQFVTQQSELDRVREERTNLKTIVLGQESFLKEINSENEVFYAFKSIIKQLEREVETEKRAKEAIQSELDLLREDFINHVHKDKQILEKSDINSNDALTRLNQEKILVEQKCTRLIKENIDLKSKLLRDNISGKTENDADDYLIEVDQSKNGLGMFKYNQQDESLILRFLVNDLDPNVALKLPPHLPSFILFMCVRYTDYINDDSMVRILLNNFMIAIKRTIKKNITNIEYYVLWLSNICKMVTFLRQYSGDENYGIFEESLKNFDLSEYRQMFCDFVHWIYHGVIKQSEEIIQPLIVPAILEYEAIASSGIYSQPGNLNRSDSSEQDLSVSANSKPTEALIKELFHLLKLVLIHVIEPELIHQIFKQLFYFICASALNNLLLRRDLCNWTKGMQIRFNLSSLEQWAREQIPNCNEVVEKLEPIIQATKILQTKKTENNLDTISEMCNKLSSAQIIKIITLYSPGEGEEISPKFIKKLQSHLASTRKEERTTTLLMDTKLAFTMTIPYNQSVVRLQNISIPKILLKKGLGSVLMKI